MLSYMKSRLSADKAGNAGKRLVVFLGVIILFSFTENIFAQQWSAEQQEVWNTINSSWKAEKEGINWIEDYFHRDCIGWNMNAPMPRNKEDLKRWDNVHKSVSKILEYQILPYAILVKDNIAIAHYYYLSLNETYDGKKNPEKGRWTDILIKEGDKWQIIGWQGGEDKHN